MIILLLGEWRRPGLSDRVAYRHRAPGVRGSPPVPGWEWSDWTAAPQPDADAGWLPTGTAAAGVAPGLPGGAGGRRYWPLRATGEPDRPCRRTGARPVS